MFAIRNLCDENKENQAVIAGRDESCLYIVHTSTSNTSNPILNVVSEAVIISWNYCNIKTWQFNGLWSSTVGHTTAMVSMFNCIVKPSIVLCPHHLADPHGICRVYW